MKNRTVVVLSFVILVTFLYFSQISYGTVITIAASTTDIDDTTMYSDSTTDNTGANLGLWVGNNSTSTNRRTLLRFNLSSIPSNAIISSVTVTLTMTKAAGGASGDQALFRVLNSWSEGTGLGRGSVPGGQGGQPVPGGASWGFRQNFSQGWTTPGGDFSNVTSAFNNVGSILGPQSWSDVGLVNDVQSWVNGSQPNNGWILIGSETTTSSARVYGASEDSVNSPSLTVIYTAPAGVNDIVWKSFE